MLGNVNSGRAEAVIPAQQTALPLVDPSLLERPLVRNRDGAVTAGVLLTQAASIAEQLPVAPCIINLCGERHHFMAALLAGMMKDATTLLLPNSLPPTLTELAAEYPDALCLFDTPPDKTAPGLRYFRVALPKTTAGFAAADIPQVATGAYPITAFTSGSTGHSQAHRKRWPELLHGARSAARRLGIDAPSSIVTTVPAQHMYGLELSILVPLAVGASSYTGRPFFPEDVRRALQEVPEPRILVTTPRHLDVLVRAGLHWPAIDFIISATAPLYRVLAEQAERALAARVFEIYGCTEAGSLASRRTLDGDLWRWLDCVQVRGRDSGIEVSGSCIPEPVILPDRLKLEAYGRFRLLGRSLDMLNIAGKRASLTDLNLRLNDIEGVEDGVLLEPVEHGTQRLVAFVVAPRLSREQILDALRQQVDSVFLPRNIHFVERLPRNETGKLRRHDLLALLHAQGSGS